MPGATSVTLRDAGQVALHDGIGVIGAAENLPRGKLGREVRQVLRVVDQAVVIHARGVFVRTVRQRAAELARRAPTLAETMCERHDGAAAVAEAELEPREPFRHAGADQRNC